MPPMIPSETPDWPIPSSDCANNSWDDIVEGDASWIDNHDDEEFDNASYEPSQRTKDEVLTQAESIDTDMDTVYPVADILDSRVDESRPTKGLQYKVRWVGSRSTAISWVHEENLVQRASLVRQYHRDNPTKSMSTNPIFDPLKAETVEDIRSEKSFEDESIDNMPIIDDEAVEDPITNDDAADDYDLVFNEATQDRDPEKMDDPQVEWEDDEPDEDLESEVEEIISTNTTVRARIMYSKREPEDADIEIHLSNKSILFIRLLCDWTGMMVADKHTQNGAIRILQTMWNRNIIDELCGDALSLFGHGLLLVTWLITCSKMHVGAFSVRTHRASDVCKSLALSGMTLVSYQLQNQYQGREEALQAVREAVEYWEGILPKLPLLRPHPTCKWLANLASDTAESTREPRNEIERDFLHALDHEGLPGVARRILEAEARGQRSAIHTFLDQHGLWLHSETLKILASMDPSLLRAIIQGRVVPLHVQEANPVWATLKVNRNHREQRPGIYGNYITDKAGMSPSAEVYRQITGPLLRRYLNEKPNQADNEWAASVDQVWAPSKSWPKSFSLRGFRRYLDWRNLVINKRSEKSSGRRKIMHEYELEMAKHLEAFRESKDRFKPLPAALTGIGYSTSPIKRCKEHFRHQNSNYIMNLIDALLKHEYPGCFGLQQVTLYNCWRYNQPWLAEITFTRLAQGYVENGGGFSHFPAGFSNCSAFQNTTMEQWAKYLRDTLADGQVLWRMTAEAEMIRARQEKERLANERRDLIFRIATMLLERRNREIAELHRLRNSSGGGA